MSEAERIWVVDRVEGGIAVLVADDDEETLDVTLGVLPPGSREGSVLTRRRKCGRAALGFGGSGRGVQAGKAQAS